MSVLVLLAAGRPRDWHDLRLGASARAPIVVRCGVAGDDRNGLANIGPCSPRLKGSVALSGQNRRSEFVLILKTVMLNGAKPALIVSQKVV